MFPVGLSGTMSVNLPAVAATTTVYSTAVTVSGVHPGDTVNCTVMNSDVRTARILSGAVATDTDQITLYFLNTGSAANAATYTVGYVVSPVTG